MAQVNYASDSRPPAAIIASFGRSTSACAGGGRRSSRDGEAIPGILCRRELVQLFYGHRTALPPRTRRALKLVSWHWQAVDLEEKVSQNGASSSKSFTSATSNGNGNGAHSNGAHSNGARPAAAVQRPAPTSNGKSTGPIAVRPNGAAPASNGSVRRSNGAAPLPLVSSSNGATPQNGAARSNGAVQQQSPR